MNRAILAAASGLALSLAAFASVLGLAPALAHARVFGPPPTPPPEPVHARTIDPHDARATQAYLTAEEAYAREASRELDSSITAIAIRGSAIAGECPAAMTYAPRDSAFEEIGEEARKTLFDAGVAPTEAIRLAFAHAIVHLRWSSRTLTKLVHGQAGEETALTKLRPPSVCANIEAWKASAYATTPPSVRTFLERAGAPEAQSGLGLLLALLQSFGRKTVPQLLIRFEDARELRRAHRIESRQARTAHRLEAARAHAGAKLAAALGISAL